MARRDRAGVLPGVEARDRGGPAAHRLDRPQRGGGEPVAGERSRAAAPAGRRAASSRSKPVERLVARLERLRDDERPPAVPAPAPAWRACRHSPLQPGDRCARRRRACPPATRGGPSPRRARAEAGAASARARGRRRRGAARPRSPLARVAVERRAPAVDVRGRLDRLRRGGSGRSTRAACCRLAGRRRSPSRRARPPSRARRQRQPHPDREPRSCRRPRAAGSRRRARSRSRAGRTAGRSSRAGSGRRRRRCSSGSRSRCPRRRRAAARARAPRPGRRMNASSSANSLAESVELDVAAPCARARRVEPKVADLEHRPALGRRAPDERRSRASSSPNENGFIR